MKTALFWILGSAAVASSLGVVLSLRNTINAALSLVLAMLALAGLYLILEAQFVGLIQVMVYAGAIVVLFLFVIMLLNLRSGGALGPDSQPIVKTVSSLTVAAAALYLVRVLLAPAEPWAEVDASYGTTRAMGESLYTTYVLGVQVAAVLLLAGIVAAVAMAKKKLD